MNNHIIGLKRGTVTLLPYNPEWPKHFELEKRRLQCTLDTIALNIQHVGSTAIPGVPAKPIIDIVMALSSLKEIDQLIEPLNRVGYEYKGERSQDQHLFVKGDEKRRTVYLHVTELNSEAWKNYLLFRDYLRSHKNHADAYAQLKLRLATRLPQNRGAYTTGKREFIEKILNQAQHEDSSSHTSAR